MTSESAAPAFPRVRRGFRRAAIVLGIILLPLAAHALWDFIEMRRLIREIELIRSKGEPVTQQEAGRTSYPLTPEGRRGSQYYLAAAALALQADQLPPGISELHEWLAGATSLAQSRQEIAKQLKSALDEEKDALALMDTANELEFREFLPGTEYNYRSAGLWRLSRLVSARTLYFSLIERPDEASRSALSSLTLRRTLRNPLGFFRPTAEIPALLSLSTPTRESLEGLQRAMETAEAAHKPEEDIAAQRAWAIETWWHRYYGIDPRAPRNYSLPVKSLTEWGLRPLFTHEYVKTLRQWAELLEAARKPWPEKIATTAEVARRYPFEPRRRSRLPYPFDLIRGVMGLRPEGVDSTPLVIDRCSRVALAVERYRRDHSGAPPRSLPELVPNYLADVPMDPASGHDVLYRQQSGAYLIYSVGVDGKDDGGDLNSELLDVIKRGWGRRSITGRDVGIRVVMH